MQLLPVPPAAWLRVLAQVLLVSLSYELVDRGQRPARRRSGCSRHLRDGHQGPLSRGRAPELPRRIPRLAGLVRRRLPARVRRPETRREGPARAVVLAAMILYSLLTPRPAGCLLPGRQAGHPTRPHAARRATETGESPPGRLVCDPSGGGEGWTFGGLRVAPPVRGPMQSWDFRSVGGGSAGCETPRRQTRSTSVPRSVTDGSRACSTALARPLGGRT